MTVDDPITTYRTACARYTGAVVAATRARQEADERYRGEVADARRRAEGVVAERDAAEAEAAELKRLVVEVDDVSADIWRRLGSYIGTKNLGMTPAPAAETSLDAPEHVRALLQRTRRDIARVQRGELPFDPPRRIVPIAAVIGVIAGIGAGWAAGYLVDVAGTASGNAAKAISQAAALVVLFVGAFIGIPVVSGWLAVRHRISIRPVHIAASIGGAVAAIGMLAPFLLVN